MVLKVSKINPSYLSVTQQPFMADWGFEYCLSVCLFLSHPGKLGSGQCTTPKIILMLVTIFKHLALLLDFCSNYSPKVLMATYNI